MSPLERLRRELDEKDRQGWEAWRERNKERERRARDEAVDQLLAGQNPPAVPPPLTRRPPGRPPWTDESFQRAYREALDRCAADAKDATVAKAMGMSVDWLRRLRRRHTPPG